MGRQLVRADEIAICDRRLTAAGVAAVMTFMLRRCAVTRRMRASPVTGRVRLMRTVVTMRMSGFAR
ncbi:hypothetical protein I553_0219 [Mycobacterium xenopi 4042]|uniref:Uncharacterized protein n=1 Tax=Mycobacterium xenopi 4042 TaxID=1299334 RepID=X7YIS5_MYCXE|nr:hypothetical protein I553_0219 [Mycobacterium xenopi 4042]